MGLLLGCVPGLNGSSVAPAPPPPLLPPCRGGENKARSFLAGGAGAGAGGSGFRLLRV